jgi:hypothetical protein
VAITGENGEGESEANGFDASLQRPYSTEDVVAALNSPAKSRESREAVGASA